MIVRFFTILQRKWTYEVEYTFEIWRLILIHVVTIGFSAIIYHIPEVPLWLYLIFGLGLSFIFWFFYFSYSIGRLIQIKANRKYAIHITYEQLVQIMDAYPKQDLYCKVNGKYKRVRNVNDVQHSDEILLITIGKNQLQNLKKYKQIVKNEK